MLDGCLDHMWVIWRRHQTDDKVVLGYSFGQLLGIVDVEGNGIDLWANSSSGLLGSAEVPAAVGDGNALFDEDVTNRLGNEACTGNENLSERGQLGA